MVRIIDDMAEVHRLQDEHGGWVDDMALVSHYILMYKLVSYTYLHTSMNLFSFSCCPFSTCSITLPLTVGCNVNIFHDRLLNQFHCKH